MPAGCEAAITLPQRGHRVALYDRGSEVESTKNTMTELKHEFILASEDGDIGAVVQRLEGIHKDTGEKIAYRSADFFRVENGRLKEHWDAVTFDGEDMFDIIELED